ncbi:transmembrane emp24 domain-containing protein 6-like [Branchiostoma floridae]|uniref:Transmembrane emp24 domain-containing protein 6-like n=1 Tax=Branchiostoma floridae TaxID=7739 RepID=A0A9J7HRJ5_BRAFL|nr:transmembrane emp24 domain-containing protein 6-like [Branchiostoma floridae]
MNIFLQFLALFYVLASVGVLGLEHADEWDPDYAPGTSFDFSIMVKPWTEECFYQYAREGAKMQVEFRVVKGGLVENESFINFMIYRPLGPPLKRLFVTSGSSDTYDIDKKGVYQICLSNPHSKFYTKVVYLFVSVYYQDEWEKFAQEEFDYMISVRNVTTTMRQVDFNVQQMRQHQAHGRMFLARDFYLIQSNKKYVDYWSLLQCVVIVGASLFQVYFVKNLFNVKSVTPTNKPRC